MRFKLIILLLITTTYLDAQVFPKSNDFGINERFVDVDTIKLNLDINPYKKTINGDVLIIFTKLLPKIDSFFIHSYNLELLKVALNGNKARYKNIPKGGIWIYPKSNLKNNNTLEIKYKASPKKGMYFTGWNDSSNRRKKQFWTQGQGIDNRHWFPSYDLQDEKAIYDIKVKFPKEYNLLSNGILFSKKNDNKNTLWHYKTQHPMSSYLVMIAGGEYKTDTTLTHNSDINKAINFEYWYYPDKKKWNDATYYKTEEIMAFLEYKIGVKYPWHKYAQIPVSDFKHGAMENTEATVFSDVYNCNDSSFVDINYLSVNAHEMAHHWFGNAITCTSAKHHWLHEGFATYYQLLAIEEFLGEDEFLWEKKLYKDRIIEASKRDNLPLTHPKAGTERFYYKGAFVLMMLNDKLGDDNFKHAIKNYTENYLYGIVETSDLISSLENSTNTKLDNYFDQWVYNYGEPIMEISYFKKNKKIGIEIKQLGKVFDFNIPIKIFSKNKILELSFAINSETDSLFFVDEIENFEIDPKIRTLASYKVNKPKSFWKNQITEGSSSYSKLEAVNNTSDINENIEIFKNIDFTKEHFKVVSAVYSQLQKLNSIEANTIKTKILKIDNSYLRKEIVASTKIISSKNKLYFESFLNTESYNLMALSLDLLCKSFPSEADNYLNKTKNISGATIPIVEIYWLKNAIIYGNFSNREKKDFSNKLVDFTSNSFEFNTRLLALSIIFEIKYFNRSLLLNLIDGSTSFNHRLVGPFRNVLKEFSKIENFNNKLKNILQNDKLTESEKNYLTKLLKI